MFQLHARLQQDTLPVGDLPLCRLLLMNDARYPWCILVPKREEVSEVFQLEEADQRLLWYEATQLAEVLKDAFAGEKMNIAALGNQVEQLHVHVIVRKRTDDAWPAPVWGRHPAIAYSSERQAEVLDRLQVALSGLLQEAP